jgi:hypothetical protein
MGVPGARVAKNEGMGGDDFVARVGATVGGAKGFASGAVRLHASKMHAKLYARLQARRMKTTLRMKVGIFRLAHPSFEPERQGTAANHVKMQVENYRCKSYSTVSEKYFLISSVIT